MERRPLIDYSDEELRDGLRMAAGKVDSYSVNDFVRELDRRASKRQVDHLTRTSYIATAAAVVSAVAALVALLASRT
jgi:hypothetical protein